MFLRSQKRLLLLCLVFCLTKMSTKLPWCRKHGSPSPKTESFGSFPNNQVAKLIRDVVLVGPVAYGSKALQLPLRVIEVIILFITSFSSTAFRFTQHCFCVLQLKCIDLFKLTEKRRIATTHCEHDSILLDDSQLYMELGYLPRWLICIYNNGFSKFRKKSFIPTAWKTASPDGTFRGARVLC